MREIKFRAWDRENSRMLNDVATGVVVIMDGRTLQDAHYSDCDYMQYTGLKDKNGVEIYEGDILEFTDKWEWYRGNYSVKMMSADQDELKVLKAQYEAEPMSRYKVKYHPYDGYGISKYDLENYLAVVGNIYQNPELLS